MKHFIIFSRNSRVIYKQKSKMTLYQKFHIFLSELHQLLQSIENLKYLNSDKNVHQKFRFLLLLHINKNKNKNKKISKKLKLY